MGKLDRTKPAALRKIRGFGSGVEDENADKCEVQGVGHWLGVEGRGLGNPMDLQPTRLLCP